MFQAIPVNFAIKDPPNAKKTLQVRKVQEKIAPITSSNEKKLVNEAHVFRIADAAEKSRHVPHRPKTLINTPCQMKREKTIPTKRSLPKPYQKATEGAWDISAICPDRDLLNQELDNEISKYRSDDLPKDQIFPSPYLFHGQEARELRLSHEKLKSRMRIYANTNGPVVNYEREKEEAFFPAESTIHSGRRQHSQNWNFKPKLYDVFEEERAKPGKKTTVLKPFSPPSYDVIIHATSYDI